MAKQNITSALFDIRPIDPQSGRVNFEVLNSLNPIIDLGFSAKSAKNVSLQEVSGFDILPVKSVLKEIPEEKERVLKELEATLAGSVDLKKELKSFGGSLLVPKSGLRPRSFSVSLSAKPVFELDSLTQKESEPIEKFRKEFSKIIPGTEKEIGQEIKFLTPPPYLPWGPSPFEEKSQTILNLSPAGRELDSVLADFKKEDFPLPIPVSALEKSKAPIYFALGLALAFAFTFAVLGTLNLKNNILQRGNQAYLNLNLAKESLSELKFFEAASSFSLAAENFELIQSDFKKISSLFKLLDGLTLGKLSGPSNLLEAGELISQAGLDLAGAFEKTSNANIFSVVQGGGLSIIDTLGEARLNLIQASRNLEKAQDLISQADISAIPEEERAKFLEFRSKLPDFNQFINKSINYSQALMVMLGQSGPQRYLVLFQNTSELRATGGFPGSYALVEFEKGVMKKFFVDDIYNPDGQIKEKIIPPKPLQKITPTWGMRDANWFVDFPASARKTAEFYSKITGIPVDGVVAINVDLIPKILQVTGPFEMSDFNVTLTSENFLTEVQEEVEYLQTKGQPKQILVEFAPKFLERLSELNQEEWLKIFAILIEGVEEKHFLTYFVQTNLQSIALENGFAGEIKQLSEGRDYLMVNHSNIMGSKTDAVIDNSVSLEITRLEDGFLHTLQVQRVHRGGNSEYGFYNKKNNDYVRVLVPEDAQLVAISGNDEFNFEPLLNYSQGGFITDPDLKNYELKIKNVGGVDIFEEGGKKVFGFWLITAPQEIKTARIIYKTPLESGEPYELYVQKQPGLKSRLILKTADKLLLDTSLDSDKDIKLEIQ